MIRSLLGRFRRGDFSSPSRTADLGWIGPGHAPGCRRLSHLIVFSYAAGYNLCPVVSTQYRESLGMSSHKGTLRP